MSSLEDAPPRPGRIVPDIPDFCRELVAAWRRSREHSSNQSLHQCGDHHKPMTGSLRTNWALEALVAPSRLRSGVDQVGVLRVSKNRPKRHRVRIFKPARNIPGTRE
jgi:hypothetical protein